MKNYEVTFKENSEKRITVEAQNEIEAVRIASVRYLETEKELLEGKNSYEVCIFADEVKPDIDDLIFAGETEDGSESFRRALTELCLEQEWCDFSDNEVLDLINELPWEEFKYGGFLDFQNVPEINIDSTSGFFAFSYGDLFRQKGIKIRSSIIEKIPGYENTSEQIELWLLEDYTFVTVRRLHMKSEDDSKGDYLVADFRNVSEETYFALIDDIYIDDFLDGIEEFVNLSMDC